MKIVKQTLSIKKTTKEMKIFTLVADVKQISCELSRVKRYFLFIASTRYSHTSESLKDGLGFNFLLFGSIFFIPIQIRNIL